MSVLATHLRARMQLLRLPLVATTLTDVWVGYFGVRALASSSNALSAVDWNQLLWMHAASVCFYFAGMTLNDAFDAKRDADLFPHRPIPRGVLSVQQAMTQGTVLLLLALGCSALAGERTLVVGCGLVVAILAYDAVLKRWALPGAIAMGLIRYLDVQLGAAWLGGPMFLPAVVLGLYVAGLTFLSTLEERPKDGRSFAKGMAWALGVLIVGGVSFEQHPIVCGLFYGPVAGLVAFMGMRAMHLSNRKGVQQLVLVLLLGIFCVNGGSLAGLGHWPLGLACLGLVGTFPALRWCVRRL